MALTVNNLLKQCQKYLIVVSTGTCYFSILSLRLRFKLFSQKKIKCSPIFGGFTMIIEVILKNLLIL